MNDIRFIKGKGLITKSIDDFIVTAYFETSIEMYENIHKLIDTVMLIEISIGDTLYKYNCVIDTSVKNYITYAGDHGVIRLDIILGNLTNLILAGTILVGDIKLITK